MGVEVVCDIVDFGVYRDPAIMVVAMLRQIMKAEDMRGVKRHD